MEAVRVASIGLGWWGGVLAEAATAAGLQVVTCFARNPDSREEFARKHGCRAAASLDALLADEEVDGVLVATPHSTHADMVVQAASAGKAAFVEKPFTLNVAEGRRAVAAAEKAGIVLQVGHNRRRVPATRRVKQLLDAGELGMIQYLEANLSNPKGLTPRTTWRGDRSESPAGGMTGLGVHMADNLIYLVGRPARLAAFSKKVWGGGTLDDVTTVTLEFESGPVGFLGTSMVIPDIARTAAYGTQAAAFSDLDGEKFYLQRVGEQAPTEQPVETLDTITDQLVEFGAAIRGEATPEVGGPEALEVVAVLEAIVESADSRRFVELDDVRSRT